MKVTALKVTALQVLNCGTAGSCHGGSGAGVYSWIADISNKTGSGVTCATPWNHTTHDVHALIHTHHPLTTHRPRRPRLHTHHSPPTTHAPP